MKIKKILISKIRTADYNPRLDLKPGDLEYEKIKRSIQEFSMVEPLVWNEATGSLIGGHQRLKILKDLGQKEIEVSVVNIKDQKREKALNVALNRCSGDWDYGKLKELLVSLDDGQFDVTMTGFGMDELESLLVGRGTEPGDDEVPEPPKKAKTKPGDLYILGDHRLLCGDATKIEDVAKLMDKKKADMVFTDPPYGVNYEGGLNKKKRENIAGDKDGQLYLIALPLIATFCSKESVWYIWFADRSGKPVYDAIQSSGYTVRAMIVWNKLNAHYGNFMAQYMQKHEPCLYSVRGKAQWNGGTKETTVWDIEQPSKNELHPTQKPSNYRREPSKITNIR